MPTSPFGADAYKLQGFKLKFARHHDSSYPNAHKKLQQSYGGIITDINDLWTDSERTALASTVALIIRRKITAEISLDTCDTADKTRISPFFQNVIICCPQHDDPDTTTALRHLGTAIANAKENEQPYVTLLISIGSWHFKPDFNPANFDDFQLVVATTPQAIKQRHPEVDKSEKILHNQAIRFAAARRRCEIKADAEDERRAQAEKINQAKVEDQRRHDSRNREDFRNCEVSVPRRQTLTSLAPIPLLSLIKIFGAVKNFQILTTFETARSHQNEPPPAEPPPNPNQLNSRRRIIYIL